MQITDAIILAAGIGSRANNVEGLHKSLLPHENIPLISHIINSAPDGVQFHIATGYKNSQVKSIVEWLYPDKKINFIYVDNFADPRSGPHTTLLEVVKTFNRPFICFPCDCYCSDATLYAMDKQDILYVYNENFPEYDYVTNINPLKFKRQSCSNLFTGVFKVYNHSRFQRDLSKSSSITEVFDGFNIREINKWLDFGSVATYHKNSKNQVPLKKDQVTYLFNDRVLKYFSDAWKCEILSHKYREFYKVENIGEHWFSYPYIQGEIITDFLSDNTVVENLITETEKFWNSKTESSETLYEDCLELYYEKTNQRVSLFQSQHPNIDDIVEINGEKVPSIATLIDKIDFNKIASTAIDVKIHGDLQPENIIYNNGIFSLIDFRPSFGKSVSNGDMYYDISKLLHGCLVSNQVVIKNLWSVNINGDSARIHIDKVESLQNLYKLFSGWIIDKNLDLEKSYLLTALHYINIAPLYTNDYSLFLFLLGKLLLYKIQSGEKDLWNLI